MLRGLGPRGHLPKDVLRACYRIGRLPPVAGGLLFSGLLAVWLTCLLPTSLEIAAGYVFGFFWATVWSTVGKVVGSILSYWIGRCARSSVRRMILPTIREEHVPAWLNSNDRGAGPDVFGS